MPRSYGFFVGAIMESGYCNGVNTLDVSENLGKNFSLQIGCNPNDLNCLRSQDSQKVQQTVSTGFWPTIDGIEFKVQPIDSIRKGNFNPIGGIILGTNLNEWSLFSCAQYENITAEQFQNFVIQTYGTNMGNALLQLYPVNKYPKPIKAMIDLGSDEVFKCPSRQAARAFSNNNIDTFLYSFEHKPSFSQGDCLGVAHSYELPFVFLGLGNTSLTPNEKILSDAIVGYWTKFAHSVILQEFQEIEAPPNWPSYDEEDDEDLVLDLEIGSARYYRKTECDFWDKFL